MKRMYRRWAKCEDRYLKEHYTDESVTVRHLADILKRTEGAVARRASQLGLYKSDEYKRQKLEEARKNGAEEYPPREVQDATYTNVCVYVLEGKGYEYIAKELKRPVRQIKEIYETAVKSGRLAAIKESRSGRYINAVSPHYNIPNSFKVQGYKNR
jgi:hypothetical protein